MSTTVGICGNGAWGNALAQSLGRNDLSVTLWGRAGEVSLAAACSCDIVILAVPTHAMAELATNISPYVEPDTSVISAAKGFDKATGATMSELLRRTLGEETRIGAVSGPNLASEIAAGKPAATVVASQSAEVAEMVRDTCTGNQVRWYSSTDLVGVEYAGALKNVIAIAAGICDGIEVGDNGKSAIITRGLAEITRLGVRAGADALTFAGLAGVGDCIATCMSPVSRNRSFGEAVASGAEPDAEVRRLGTVEGIDATEVALSLADRYGVEVPIARAVYEVIFQRRSVGEAMAGLMARDPADELPTSRRDVKA
jgi:glycerol-3-phosphate dehydrogenase (NAD(P)+)